MMDLYRGFFRVAAIALVFVAGVFVERGRWLPRYMALSDTMATQTRHIDSLEAILPDPRCKRLYRFPVPNTEKDHVVKLCPRRQPTVIVDPQPGEREGDRG